MKTTPQEPRNELEETSEAISDDHAGAHNAGDGAHDPNPGWTFLVHKAEEVAAVVQDIHAGSLSQAEARPVLEQLFREAHRRRYA